MSMASAGIPGYLSPPPPTKLGLPPMAWRVMIVLVVALVVELISRLGIVDRFTLVPVTEMLMSGAALLATPEFYADAIWPSLFAILLSFALSVVLGVALGYIIWRADVVRTALDPYLTAYYAIPTFALYPLLVVVYGTGRLPIVILATLFSIVAVMTSSMNGYDSVPPVVTKLARSLVVTRRQYFFRFFLPWAVPNILIGLRLAFLYSVLSVLAAEFLLANEGLGHFISINYTTFQMGDMYAGVLVVIVLAILAERLITALVNRFTWVGGQG